MRRLTFWLLLVLVFMIPWENAVTIEQVGTLIRITGILVAAVWALTVLPQLKYRKPDAFHAAALLFLLWNAASMIWTHGPDETLQRVLTLSQLLVMVWVVWDLTTTMTDLKAVMQAYVLGGCVTITGTIVNFSRGEMVKYRYTAADLNADDLALILALGLPLAWHLATSRFNGKNNLLLRMLNYAYIPAALFAMALTGARMGLVVMIPPIVYMLLTSRRLKLFPRVLVFMALAAASLALYSQIPSGTIERLATTGSSITTGDLGGRVSIWREGLSRFADHPVLGLGGGSFQVANPRFRSVAHNTVLSVLSELGIIGVLIFAGVMVITGLRALRQPPFLSGVWLTVFLTWALGASVLTWEHRKPTWLFLGLIVVSANLGSQRDTSLAARTLPG
jgi:O-antigen ligase